MPCVQFIAVFDNNDNFIISLADSYVNTHQLALNNMKVVFFVFFLPCLDKSNSVLLSKLIFFIFLNFFLCYYRLQIVGNKYL